ncbi:hypothetical protein [Nitratireductor aquimarinus]|uniref:hypothetical protein n=1 Tax=Nitratireductor aquimarinus TaxID=889300 RepID=UPI003B59FF91
MSKNDALKLKIDVPLKVPVPVKDAEGKEAERRSITIRRPKTRHTKRLAAMIGGDLLSLLLADGDEAATSIQAKVESGGRDMLAKLAAGLLTTERLDELTELIADMCDEPASVIDEIDVIDLPALGAAFLGFFPGLQSAASTAWLQMSDTSSENSPTS